MSPPPPSPARFILPVSRLKLSVNSQIRGLAKCTMKSPQFIHGKEWRDRAGIDAPLMRASFPSAAIECMDYWEDLAMLGRTFVFDRAMIVSRESSARQYVPISSLLPRLSSVSLSDPSYSVHSQRCGSK
jgi:hypothetical protein